jgi:hypothetical protein
MTPSTVVACGYVPVTTGIWPLSFGLCFATTTYRRPVPARRASAFASTFAG